MCNYIYIYVCVCNYIYIYTHNTIGVVYVLGLHQYTSLRDDMILMSHTAWLLTYPSEKYEFVSWDYDSKNNKKCSKPPTSIQV